MNFPTADLGGRERIDPKNTVTQSAEVIRLSSVAPTGVKWLWEQRIALGKLTLVAGDPGLGKSYLTLDLASRVSTGEAMPGDCWDDGRPMQRKPRMAVLLSAEDDPSDTIRPRLDAAGADPERVLLVAGVRTGEHVRTLNLKEDLKFLRGLCEREDGIRLIVIDPISAYLGDDEGHSNTKVRNLLAPLAKLAQDFDVAVVAVTHLNKSGGQGGAGSAIYRTMGSLAFTAAARAVHLVARDPDDPDKRLLLPIKNNLGQDRQGYGFTLTHDHPHHDARIQWDPAPTEETADQLLARLGTPSSGKPKPAPQREQAEKWLKDALAGGSRPIVDLEQEAHALGITPATFRRARRNLGLVPSKTASGWHLKLPKNDAEAFLYRVPDTDTQGAHLDM
ncbi:MAG: AAA family ATPase [Planctomycetota bacterium]